MYTQCPECGTVFRVTAEALRTAQGSVRCGICSSGFNAIEYLSEQPLVRVAGEESPEDTMTVEELPGTEFIELSASFEHGATDAQPGSEDDAEDSAGDDRSAAADALDEVSDAALEFRGSPEDLERMFVAAAPGLQIESGGQPVDLAGAIGEVASSDFSGIEVHEERLPWPDDAPEMFGGDAHPGRIAAVLAFPRATAAPAGEDPSAALPGPEAAPAGGESAGEPGDGQAHDLDRTDEYPLLVIDEADQERLREASLDSLAAAAAAGRSDAAAPEADAAPYEAPPPVPIPEELRRSHAASESREFADLAEGESADTPRRRWPLAVALVALVAILAVQLIHFWRDDLVRNPSFGPWLLRGYALLGADIAIPVDLAAFEIRQLGAASEPSQAGRIKVRASIVNRAAFAQPLPLLRLKLQDRFGSTIGTRDLEPQEYLPGGSRPASGLLDPSQRADAQVVFVDPGRDAVGFELDVCLRDDSGLRCSADLPGNPR